MDISNIGPIKTLRAPEKWKRVTVRVSQGSRMDLPVVLLVPEQESAARLEIGIFYRGRLESEEDGQYFHQLLEQHVKAIKPTALTPTQIKSLTRVLDLVGFNQYSYPTQMSGYMADFYLRTAQIHIINEKAVLRVDGEFKADNKTDVYYNSLFIDADNRGRKVYEIYLLSSDKDLYLRHLTVFKEMTESIEWQTLERSTIF